MASKHEKVTMNRKSDEVDSTNKVDKDRMTPQLPLIHIDENGGSTFEDFQESFSTFAGEKFKILWKFPTTGKIPEISEPKQKVDEASIMFELRCKEYLKNLDLLEQEKRKMFSTIYGNMSLTSKIRVAEEDFDRDDWDLVQLWKRILTTHRSGGSNVPILNQTAVRNAYNRRKHGPNEEINQYFQQFKRNVVAYESVYPKAELANNKPSDAQQAADFIDGLNERYDPFKNDLINAANSGTPYPATLEEALMKATRYKVVYKPAKVNQLSSFSTQVSTQHNQRGKPDSYGKRNAVNNADNDTNDEDNQSETKPKKWDKENSNSKPKRINGDAACAKVTTTSYMSVQFSRKQRRCMKRQSERKLSAQM
jgi:hypothetical protein